MGFGIVSILAVLGLSVLGAILFGALTVPMEYSVEKLHDNNRIRKTIRWIFLIPEGVTLEPLKVPIRTIAETLNYWTQMAFLIGIVLLLLLLSLIF